MIRHPVGAGAERVRFGMADMEGEAGRRARNLPGFAVELLPPDLSAWRDGNTGVRGFTTLDSGVAGPHVAVVSLMHGNRSEEHTSELQSR